MIKVTDLPREEFASQKDYDEAVKVVHLLNTIMDHQDRGLWVFNGNHRITDRYTSVPNDGDFLLGDAEYNARIDYHTVGFTYVSRWSDCHYALASADETLIRCDYNWIIENQFSKLHVVDPNNLQPLVIVEVGQPLHLDYDGDKSLDELYPGYKERLADISK